MDMSEKIRILAIRNKINVQTLAEKSGQSSSNLYHKLQRNTFKVCELEKLAESVNATVEINFILPNGEKI